MNTVEIRSMLGPLKRQLSLHRPATPSPSSSFQIRVSKTLNGFGIPNAPPIRSLDIDTLQQLGVLLWEVPSPTTGALAGDVVSETSPLVSIMSVGPSARSSTHPSEWPAADNRLACPTPPRVRATLPVHQPFAWHNWVSPRRNKWRCGWAHWVAMAARLTAGRYSYSPRRPPTPPTTPPWVKLLVTSLINGLTCLTRELGRGAPAFACVHVRTVR